MNVDLVAGSSGLANLVGSAAIVALGFLVLLPRPRGRPQWSFALLAWGIGIGAAATTRVVPDAPAWTTAMWMILAIGHVVALVGLIGVVGSVTGGLVGRDRIWAAAAFALVATVSHVGYFLSPGPTQAFAATGYPVNPALVPGAVVATLVFAALWTGAFVLARWAARPGVQGHGQAALLSSALVVYPAAIATGDGLAFPTWRWLALGAMVAAACVSAAWLFALWRRGQRVMLLASLAPLAIVAMGLLLGGSEARWVGGASRIVMTALVAFAILRYHALGIDAKLRFGISKGTVAGIVVAVVFVASEGAQSFFGEDKQWVGLAVGGLVVFAIAPIQRVAERFAEKAVPVVGAPPAGLPPSRVEATYRAAFRAAMRDGRLTQREELYLAEVAENLGIGHRRVAELRGEAQAEARHERATRGTRKLPNSKPNLEVEETGSR